MPGQARVELDEVRELKKRLRSLEQENAVEAVYHRRRRQRVLGRLTPIEYEMIKAKPAATAA